MMGQVLIDLYSIRESRWKYVGGLHARRKVKVREEPGWVG